MKQTYDGRLRKLSRTDKRIDSLRSNNTNKGLGKKINPIGANRKPLLCNSCGSSRHLLAECPDSWENMEKKKVSKKGLNSMFLCVEGGICSETGLTRLENKGDLQVG